MDERLDPSILFKVLERHTPKLVSRTFETCRSEQSDWQVEKRLIKSIDAFVRSTLGR